jgi:hypothetical protein
MFQSTPFLRHLLIFLDLQNYIFIYRSFNAEKCTALQFNPHPLHSITLHSFAAEFLQELIPHSMTNRQPAKQARQKQLKIQFLRE